MKKVKEPRLSVLKKWDEVAQDLLLGRKIKKAGYSEYDGAYGIQIDLDDGTSLYPMSGRGDTVGVLVTSMAREPVWPAFYSFDKDIDLWGPLIKMSLVGKKIAHAQYEFMYRDNYVMVLQLTLSDRITIHPMADAKRKDPGFFATNLPDCPELPVITF